jgi:hypothetical protein
MILENLEIPLPPKSRDLQFEKSCPKQLTVPSSSPHNSYLISHLNVRDAGSNFIDWLAQRSRLII